MVASMQLASESTIAVPGHENMDDPRWAFHGLYMDETHSNPRIDDSR